MFSRKVHLSNVFQKKYVPSRSFDKPQKPRHIMVKSGYRRRPRREPFVHTRLCRVENYINLSELTPIVTCTKVVKNYQLGEYHLHPNLTWQSVRNVWWQTGWDLCKVSHFDNSRMLVSLQLVSDTPYRSWSGSIKHRQNVWNCVVAYLGLQLPRVIFKVGKSKIGKQTTWMFNLLPQRKPVKMWIGRRLCTVT